MCSLTRPDYFFHFFVGAEKGSGQLLLAIWFYYWVGYLFKVAFMVWEYWQLPVHPKDQEKTAFCFGPGMGLYEFCRMLPWAIRGAPFQRLMDKVLHGLSFIPGYFNLFYRCQPSCGSFMPGLQAAGLTL